MPLRALRSVDAWCAQASLLLVRIVERRTGKYVGSRPVKISKATTKVGAVEIGDKKAKELEKRLKTQAKRGIAKMSGLAEDSRGHMVRRATALIRGLSSQVAQLETLALL